VRAAKLNPFAVLTLILRDYQAAISNPMIARAVLFARTSFDDSFVASIVAEIRSADGNWRTALAALPVAFRISNHERLVKFKAWAEKISRRPVAGLLEWKGGAS
jgi:hypothetical protein